MKLLRIICLIIFLLSTIGYAGYKGFESNSRDTLGPELIYENDSISVSVMASVEEQQQNVTAFDDKDGDVTDSILIEDISNFTPTGTRIITYAAFDSSRHITKAERELVYTDYIPPRFSLSKPLRFNVGDTDSILNNMTVQDSIDGDLTDKIKYESQENQFGQSEGIYEVEFQVTNSAGDTAYLPADVEFYYANYQNSLVPEILLREYIIYIKVGDSVDEDSYLQGINIGRDEYLLQEDRMLKSEVLITSNGNSNVPGVYDIEYSMTSEDGYTGTTKLLVVVEE